MPAKKNKRDDRGLTEEESSKTKKSKGERKSGRTNGRS